MKVFECESCESEFNSTVLHEGVEVCPVCKSESYMWTVEGMKSAAYWKAAYWGLKSKHDRLTNDIKNAIRIGM